MLRSQFLCYVLKTSFFIKIALKLNYFCKKMQNLRALGAPPPDPKPPLAFGGWRLRPQTQKLAPHCEFLATRLVPFLVKTFFWSSPEFGKKSVLFLVNTFFFALHLICSPEKNGDRGSSTPMLKIGQNWGKIAN